MPIKRILMLMTIFNAHGEELESESLPLSSGSATQSVHSHKPSNSLHQSKNSSEKSKNSSHRRRSDHHHQRNQLYHERHSSLIIAGLLIVGILLIITLSLGMISHFYSHFNLGNGTMFFPQMDISESCPMKDTNPKTHNFDESSLSFLRGSKQSITDLFVAVQPEEVECYGSMTLFSLQIRMFWESCVDPMHLFSNKLIQKALPLEKKWSYKAEIVTFEIQLLETARIQGLLVNLEEFQFQYYLRNNIKLQLYGNFQKNKHKSILLLDEKLTAQHLVRNDRGDVLLFLYFNQNEEQFSSLSLKLRSKSTLLHQIIGLSILERKTYRRDE